MRFDDRLSTVLDHPVRSDHDRAVRWRQLVELVARAGSSDEDASIRRALEVIGTDAKNIDEELRAAAARSVAALPLPFDLVALFARDSVRVSAPVLAAAQLDSDGWQSILENADGETAQFIRTLRPELPRRQAVRQGTAQPPSPAAEKAAAPSIKEVIHRIEAIREAREQAPPAAKPTPPAPKAAIRPVAAPQADEDGLFRWECGPSGDLEWVEGAPRAALIGRPLVEPGHDRESGSGEIARAFELRAPFSNALITLAEDNVLAGDWELSGIPAFEHTSGRFAGYRGVARRTHVAPRRTEAAAIPHPHTLRELVHEIKTPLNAIMGFAEIIQRQMFGPAGSSYRERAQEIAVQSHLLLTAIDDLDRAARGGVGQGPEASYVHLDRVLERLMPMLRQHAEGRGVTLDWSTAGRGAVAIDEELAERLVLRLCNAVVDRARAGEQLRVSVETDEAGSRLAITRPAALQGQNDASLFGGGERGPQVGLWLRLARGLAQIAGVDFETSPEAIALSFPRSSLGAAHARSYGDEAGAGPVAQR